MKEELLLEEKFGKPNCFKVPEGYFDNLAESIVGKLPQSTARPKHVFARFLRPVTWAASIAIAVFSTIIYLNLGDDVPNKQNVAAVPEKNVSISVNNDYMVDEISDIAMLDNDDLYSFMADE